MYIRFPLSESPGSAAGAGSPLPSGSGGGSPSPSSPGSQLPSAGSQSQTPGAPGSPSPNQSPANQGPVPYERFSEVNTKYNNLSWAEQYDRQQTEEAHRLYSWLDTDPQGAYEYLTGLMKRQGYLPEPQRPPSANGQQPQGLQGSDGRPLPDILIQETGQRLYSAEQAEKLLDWKMQSLDSRFKPLEGMHSSQQARAEAQSMIADAERNWPHFSDHAELIFKELQKDRRLSLEGAYRRVVVPELKKLERQAVMQELRDKGNAGTINPGSPPALSSDDEKKLPMKELFRREMQKRGLGT